jgi:hypothetical protein
MTTSTTSAPVTSMSGVIVPRHYACGVKRAVRLATYTWFISTLFQAQAWAQVHASQPHEASESSRYDKLLDRAIEAFENEDFAHAFDAFEQAYKLRPNARVQRGLGIAALRLNRFGEAKRALSSALEDKRQPLTQPQADEARQLLEWMRTNLGTVNLHVSRSASTSFASDDSRSAPTSSYEVWIDNARLRDTAFILLSPGTHVLVVRAPEFETYERSITISAGSEERLDVKLSKPASVASAPSTPTSTAPVSPAQAAATVPVPTTTTVTQPIEVPSRVGQTPKSRATSNVLTSWWFWTALGVVAVGGVTSALVLTREPSTKPYETSSFGGVIMPLERTR